MAAVLILSGVVSMVWRASTRVPTPVVIVFTNDVAESEGGTRPGGGPKEYFG